MKIKVLIICLGLSLSALGQDETIILESSASMVLSGDIKLVLDDISLTNEGSLDATDGEVVVSSSSSSFFSTTQSLYLNSLVTADNNVDFNMEGEFEVSDLTLASSDNLIFSDTSSLTLSGEVNATGEITMESGSALWIKGTITETALDNVTVERIGPHNSTTGKYSVYGAPVDDAAFSVLGTNAQSWIYEHNESTKDFSAASGSMMTPGKGYFVAFPGDSEGSITFNGSPNYKNFTYPLTRTNSGLPDERGFNLIANPFTCPVEFDDFISDSGNESLLEESTIWIWDDYASDTGGGTSDDYLAINYLGSSSYDITDSRNGGETNWDGTINVAQGFFVKASASGDISFKQNMKTLEGNDDASFFRVEPSAKYWLKIANESIEGASTLLGFIEDATYEKDALYDASRFGGGFAIYSVVDDYKLAIQGIPTEWLTNYDDQHLLSLGYNVAEAGMYTISLAAQEGSQQGALYLNDHLNLSSVNILTEAYQFATEAGSVNDRFSISLEPLRLEEVLSEEPSVPSILIYGRSNSLVLNASFEGRYKVSTLSGKHVYEATFLSGRTELPLASGLYIISVESPEGFSSYKVSVSN